MAAIKRILIIEDDQLIGEMYQRSLTGAGYQVDLVNNGSDGLEAALSGGYDLILLDIMLSEKKGDEILKALRGNGTNLIPNTRIFITTNYEQPEEEKLAAQGRVDGYFIKANLTPHRLRDIIASLN